MEEDKNRRTSDVVVTMIHLKLLGAIHEQS